MEKTYCIYMHKNRINNKMYIGQTCQNPPQLRWGKNGINYKNCPKFGDAIQKYGWDNFEHIILKDNLTLEEANYWEAYYIKEYHTWIEDPLCWGYNLQSGGSNYSMDQETKNKISEALTGRTLSEETRYKLSEIAKTRTGAKNNFYGKHHTEETKGKIRQAHLGKHLSEETKKKISEAVKQENHPNWGKHLSDETKKKIGKGGVICTETNEYFCSSNEAAKAKGLANGAHIREVCRGKRKTAAKLHWKWVNEVE